ncbi:MAG: hypothetical protein AAFV53_24450 [Myxococcota bacterium]
MSNEEDSYTPPPSRAFAAWPLIAAMQLAVVLVLIGLFVRAAPPRSPPIEERLRTLPVDTTNNAVLSAIDRLNDGRALTEDDESTARSALSLLVVSAEMRLDDLRFRTGHQRDGVQPVDAELTIIGDPYRLPIFIDGLAHQRALAHPLSVRGSSNTPAQFEVIVRYYRPAPMDTAWIAPRLQQQAPDATDAAPLLVNAATLASWRHFQQKLGVLTDLAGKARRDAASALPSALIALEQRGEPMQWRLQTPLLLTGQPYQPN